MGVYDKEPLSCPGHSEIGLETLKGGVIHLIPLVCLLKCKAVKNHPK